MLCPQVTLLLAVCLTATIPPVAATGYTMVKTFAGSTFFNDWQFYNNYDNLTNGDAIFVSSSVAASSHLAYIDPSTNHAIIKVDNTSTVPYNQKRNTVRISTNDNFSVGSVWTVDMLHVPYGCSVWPAWWSQAPAWPTGGEIDTFEGVNMVTNNQMGLHTLAGCKQVSQVQSSTLINSTDCSYLTNSNEGCITTNPSTASYGAGFAQAGGGMFVKEFAETGISIWFFSRANIPSVLSSNSSTIDTSTLGTPVGNWPAAGCNIDTFFAPQNLILDITLCGDFAGPANIFAETCPGTCYNDYVVGNGSNYATAYFEIASVNVFSETGTNTIVAGNSASALGFSLSTLASWLGVIGCIWLFLA
ncbi:glycoside hydrolase family 16 protein [Laccaria amethystina LaAM-08-1]|uniref:Glycoside hydrolase family 16 protein n=1 Tax=Laccaria amethystina LaAM-08-1 TaxID=1095629 RepID=A0A0C9Y7M8_9AGAR|nr:glycoside hydrolase family 16 protein [Laccaria amethystina LaAM-08-1]